MVLLFAHKNKDSFQATHMFGQENKCCQLADDTLLFQKGWNAGWKILNFPNEFSKVSGLWTEP